MAVPKGAKRELFDVRVKYVSMVKNPANRRKFSLVKSAGAGEMVMVYKSADWEPPAEELGPLARIFQILTKAVGFAGLKRDNGESGADDAAASISEPLQKMWGNVQGG